MATGGHTSILRAERAHGHGGMEEMVLMPDGLLEMIPKQVANMTTEIWARIPVVNATAVEGDFANVTHTVEKDIVLFWEAPIGEWIVLFVVVALLLCIDSYVNSKLSRDSRGGTKKHAALVLAWITCGLGYNIAFAARHGLKDGLQWFMGYALEWMLSLDNLFAFQVIVRMYGAPPEIQHKALFFGVVTSVMTRLALFWTVGKVLHSIHYVQFAFGFILIYAGIQALHDDGDLKDPNDLIFIRVLKACLGTRLKDSYDLEDKALFVVEDGRWCATLLVPLIFCVEVTDIIFAVDSVSAKVAQIPNQYIAYSSSVLALLGLRAMYFVIDDLVRYFTMLKYGVCFILVFIGCELMISGRYQLPDWIVCVVIVSIFNLCIVFSLVQQLASGSSTGQGDVCQGNHERDESATVDDSKASSSGLLGEKDGADRSSRSSTGSAPCPADSGAG